MSLPININDLITCRTVASARIEFKEDGTLKRSSKKHKTAVSDYS